MSPFSFSTAFVCSAGVLCAGLQAQDSTPDHALDLCDAVYTVYGNAQFKVAIKGNLFVFPWPDDVSSNDFFSVKYYGDGEDPEITYFDAVSASGSEGSVAFTDDFLIYTINNETDPTSGDRTGVSVVYELNAESGDLTECTRFYPASPGYDNSLVVSRPPLDADSDQFVCSAWFAQGDLARTSIYKFDGANWALDDQIDRTDGYRVRSVAIDGDLLVISYSDDLIDVYERGASSWDYKDSITRISNTDISASTRSTFGGSIDVHGSLIAISDRFANYSPSGTSIDVDMGACYIYSYISSSVSNEAVLFEYSGSSASESLFGNAIDFSDDGGLLVIGAPDFDRVANSYYDEGAAFVYDTSDFTLSPIQYTDGSNDEYGNHIFGEAVTFSGSALNVFNTAIDYTAFGVCSTTGNGHGISIYDAVSISACTDADLSEPYGQLDFFDVSTFLVAFNAMDSIADWNNDSAFNFFDVSGYLTEFQAGCP